MEYNIEGLEIWEEKFRPIKNAINPDSGWNGTMFETYGEELNFVLKQDPHNIWTWWDVDGGSELVAGYHLVNRIGYFITEEQWTGPMDSYPVEIAEF
jgi:hypothetical protein